MIIDLVVGARPNFVKAAAILHAAEKYPEIKINLIHTGQHTGEMADSFFAELDLPKNQVIYFSDGWDNIPVQRLSNMMLGLSARFETDKPDYVMVVGDTDSTLAGALTATKMGIPLIHVEAGLRCWDLKMQEEINRMLVDTVSSIAYTTTEEGRYNLIAEGFKGRMVTVGNVMIDTLLRFLPKALKQNPRSDFRPYAVLTLHRPETVDHDHLIFPILDAIRSVAEKIDVFFPIHPRLRSRIGAWHNNGQFIFAQPLSYLQFIALLSRAQFVMTDSGGVQEETTALGIPCLTLRPSTERPETVERGTNHVIGTDPETIQAVAECLIDRKIKSIYPVPELWDGHAADRIMEDLVKL